MKIKIKTSIIISIIWLILAWLTVFIIYPYPWEKITFWIGENKKQISEPPLMYAYQLAEHLKIPVSIKTYVFTFKYKDHNICQNPLYQSSLRIMIKENEPLATYAKKGFKNSCMESSLPVHDFASGIYNFCLESSEDEVSFEYPSNLPVSFTTFLLSSGLCDFTKNSIDNMKAHPLNYEDVKIYAKPLWKEWLINVVGIFVVWGVIIAAFLTIFQFIKK